MRFNVLLFLLAGVLVMPLLTHAQNPQATPQPKAAPAPGGTFGASAPPPVRGRAGGGRWMYSTRPDDGRGMGWRRFGAGMRGRMLDALNLSVDQRKRLHDQDVAREKAAIQNRAQLETRQLELRELMNGDHPDRSAIDGKIDEIEHLRAAQMKADVAARLDFEGLLTPEQKAKMKQFRGGRLSPGPGMGMGRRRMRVGPPPRPVTPPTQDQ